MIFLYQFIIKLINALRKPELIHLFKFMRIYLKKTIKLLISVLVLSLLFVFSTLWYFSSGLPDYKILANYKPPISSRVHSGEGQLIAEYALQKRLFIPYEFIPKNVIEFLAHKITSNIRELEGALKRLVAHSQLVGRPVSLESAQDVLHDLLRANNRKVTIEEIQKKVAEYFNIRLSDMSSPRRARAVARPRQIAMYLSKQLTSKSLPEIGRTFGGRDHTTVMHAVNRIDELSIEDSLLSDDIELLKRTLDS